MLKFKVSPKFIGFLISLGLSLYFITCIFSTMVFRVFQGDGARLTLGLLGSPEVYYETPYIRFAAVFLQWPYLLTTSLFDLDIEQARWLISFSYSFVPFIYVLFFLFDGLQKKNLKWFWIALGIATFIQLPQWHNQFNTVVEGAFLFLMYLYLEENGDRKIGALLRIFLLCFLILSHETSILYTFLVAFLPTIRMSCTNRKFTLVTNWEFFCGILATSVILVHFLLLPSLSQLRWPMDFYYVIENPNLWLISLFFLLCFTLGRSFVGTLICLVTIVYILLRFWPHNLTYTHYPFRLIASLVAGSWCLIHVLLPDLYKKKMFQCSLILFLGYWCLKDMTYSNVWNKSMNQFELYLLDKENCYHEKNPDTFKALHKMGFFSNDVVTFTSFILSPSYENPKIVLMPFSKERAQPDFNSCEYPHEDYFAMDERSIDKMHHFWLSRLHKFNLNNLYFKLPIPQLKLSQTYSPYKKMLIHGIWMSDDYKFKAGRKYQIKIRARGQCLKDECPEIKISVLDQDWTIRTKRNMQEYIFDYQSKYEESGLLRLEYLNDKYLSFDEDMNLELEKVEISPAVVKK